jgi:YbbR domain-containing protein
VNSEPVNVYTMTNHRLWAIFRRRHEKWLVFCFLLGVTAILSCSGFTAHEAEFFIPVEISGIPSGLTVTGSHLKGIEVRVRGPKSALETLAKLKPKYLLDLSGAGVGVKTIYFDQHRIALPKGVTIIKITPELLTIRIENEIKKELPVIISLSGKPASGFIVAGAVAKPLSSVLRGPQNILGPMEKVLTKPIDIKGMSESFKKEIVLDLAEDLEVISASKVVFAEIFIEEKIAAKLYHDIPVEGRDTQYRYSVSPPGVNIEVKGPVNVLEKLYAEKGIKVYVDLKGLKPGMYVRRASIALPLKTTLVNAEPEIFTVKIYNP